MRINLLESAWQGEMHCRAQDLSQGIMWRYTYLYSSPLTPLSFPRIEAITLTALDQDAMGLSSALPMEQAVFRKLDYGQVRRWPLGEEGCDKKQGPPVPSRRVCETRNVLLVPWTCPL